MKTAEFFATHPVFSLREATKALAPRGGTAGTVQRLRHHLEVGRLKVLTRGVYAVVPPGIEAGAFVPDPYLAAAAIRPLGVLAYHSALELLGAAHSVWNLGTMFTASRRPPLAMGRHTLRFVDHPRAMKEDPSFATRRIERGGRLLMVTGPERTLVEGFRRPGMAGGFEEHVLSIRGFTTLDLDLLEQVLRRYGIANLWGAAGWFLEQSQGTFHVPDAYLERLERHRPRSPQYLLRDRRGGRLAARWNVILPDTRALGGEPDAA